MVLGLADKAIFAYLILAAFFLGACSIDLHTGSVVLTNVEAAQDSIIFTSIFGIFILSVKAATMCCHYEWKMEDKKTHNRISGFTHIFLFAILARVSVFFMEGDPGSKLMLIHPTPSLLCLLTTVFISYFLFSAQSATLDLWKPSDYQTQNLIITLINIGVLIFSILITSVFELSDRRLFVIVMTQLIFSPLCLISTLEICGVCAEVLRKDEAESQAKTEEILKVTRLENLERKIKKKKRVEAQKKKTEKVEEIIRENLEEHKMETEIEDDVWASIEKNVFKSKFDV